MRTHTKILITGLILTGLLLASCSGALLPIGTTQTPGEPAATSTALIPQTGATPTPAATFTATSSPALETPTPTRTATPTVMPTPTAVTPTPTSTATLAVSSSPAAGATAPAAAATPVVPSGGTLAARVVAAANAFLATLEDSQRSAVQFDWSDTAQKQRWSNQPQGLFQRAGLMWGDLNESQRNAWLVVMRATLSEEGYNRVMTAWNADDVLAAEHGSAGGSGPGGQQMLFGKQYYWIAMIGAPSETSPWQWQWGGHHVTLNATIAGANVALTPTYLGCEPCEYQDAAGNVVRPLGDIEDEAFALLGSLDDYQRSLAILGDAPIDLVLGPGQDNQALQTQGLPGSRMNAEQRAAFLRLIRHYTGLVHESAAAARLAEVQATLGQTALAWYGADNPTGVAYFRITGPALVIEYSPQGSITGYGLGGNAITNHIHGVYRDPTNDYGAKITK